ncbi:MAG: carbon storage regulator [Fuerstia sp.]|nr:carbon storage regulator [Fuerstiella sp.]
MLVLTRKCGEEIVIDGGIRIQVLESKGGRVRLGISAPRDVLVARSEVYSSARVNTSPIDLETPLGAA